MKRTQANFAIDAVAFATFAFLYSTGLLLRYQLPAGSGGLNATGTGRAAVERPVTLLWGWTRHQWGEIHYWIAGLLLAVVAVHVVLHWKWVVCVVRGTKGDSSGSRFGVGVAALIALMLLAAAPLLARTESLRRSELEHKQSVGRSLDDVNEGFELRGSMSVAEVAEAAGLSVAQVLEKAGLPGDVSPDEQIGRILRDHGRQMNDLRQSLRDSRASRARGGEFDE